MNLNKYTEKAQEAILAAQRIAEQSNHAQIDPEHLLLALGEQPDGIVPALLRKMSVEPKAVTDNLRGELSKQPAAYGGSQPAPSPRLRKVTEAAESEAERLNVIGRDEEIRPLKRAIQRHILDPLAMRVLEGDFRKGELWKWMQAPAACSLRNGQQPSRRKVRRIQCPARAGPVGTIQRLFAARFPHANRVERRPMPRRPSERPVSTSLRLRVGNPR